MAAVPWKPLFWERFNESFTVAGVARDSLLVAARDLSSLLRGVQEDRVLVRIDKCQRKLAEASRLLAVAISVLGTVELLALRCMRSEDSEEVRARPRARAARELASHAYDAVSSSRGHLGAAGRLVAATGVPDHAVEEERVAVLAAIEAALDALNGIQQSRRSDASFPDVVLPRAQSRTRSAAETPSLVGSSSDAAAAVWISLGNSTPGSLFRVAISGAVPELEAAHAALRVVADGIEKNPRVAAAALGLSASTDWSGYYSTALLALDAAHNALSALLAVKGESDMVFLRCAPQLGLNRGGPGWICWEAARADAERHGRAALDHLWSASSFVDYCLAGVLTWGSAGQEARELMLRALANAGQARVAGDQLRHAAGRSFYHARKVLQGVPSSNRTLS
uniref:Uncharacterized protein n=1 Tax=Avena sativa TaxID=4498 RepID=A0ACD5VET4_AVESA